MEKLLVGNKVSTCICDDLHKSKKACWLCKSVCQTIFVMLGAIRRVERGQKRK